MAGYIEEIAAYIHLRVLDWTRGLVFTLGLDRKNTHVFIVFIDQHVIVR